MAVSNRDRVGRAFEQLAEGIGPWVAGELQTVKGDGWFDEVAKARRNPDTPASVTDPYFLLKAMWDHWRDVFERTLGRSERTMVNELIGARNRWAHNDAFNFDDAYRTLDSIERLLTSVSAAEQAEAVAQAKGEVLRQRYEAEAKRATPTQEQLAVGAVKGLKPWREVITPHQDVADGTFKQAEFAAHLGRVARGEGPPEYVDAVEFFRRTYLTGGLRQLLGGGLRRVAGSGGHPVVDLQTSFGGGKTHSMLALYHLFSGVSVADLPEELMELCAEVGITELPSARRVVLVGTELRPGEPIVKDDGTVVNTLWGELAWQLGGAEAYAEVATVDANRTSPGDRLASLFRKYGPCLILIDEWVAYARQLYSRDDLSGGSLDTQVSFAQALTEQSTGVDGTLVVVSIPASTGGDDSDLDSVSESEVGGFGGREALRKLRAVVGRMDSPWSPATAVESFEIVRQRLFEPLVDAERLADRDAAARTFTEFYRKQSAEFPTECREASYSKRIVDAYPIHPELFARLYEDWSTLERFQRTRGVLRLMAAVVHALWREGDAAPLVLPASVPLDDATVATELLKNLSEGWKPIVDADIDGPNAAPVELDRTVPSLGRYQAARRVARAVFLGSAPAAGSETNRGIEAQRVRLGCVIPGESVATFGDALNRLSERSTYLYHEGPRYWYGTQQSVTKRAQERADQIRQSQRDDVHLELIKRIKTERDRGEFGSVHVAPETSADVPDEDVHVRLIILDPSTPHAPRSQASTAVDAAREILERRGNSAREYRNVLVFAAADARRTDDLERAAAEYLAWSEIDSQADELNLDALQRRMAGEKRAFADDAVRSRLGDAYQWVLVPTQPDPVGEITWEPVRVDSSGAIAAKISRKLGTEDLLRSQFPGVLLRLQLDGPLQALWSDGHVTAKELWDCFARYVYLPRLRDLDVLLGAVEGGPASTTWAGEGFAVAAGEEEKSGRYLGLVTGSRPDGPLGPSTLVVRPDVALGQLEQEGGDDRPGPAPEPGPGPKPAPKAVARRFHGAKRVDLARPVKDFERLMTEVLKHLEVDGSEVALTLEIEAASDGGFPEQVVRIVTENAAALGFEPGAGFEEQ